MSQALLSIVLPAFNEERTIYGVLSSLYAAILSSLPSFQFEFIIVNDGSTDNTSQQINKFLDCHLQCVVRTINLSRRQGIGHALKKGTLLACGQHICWIDADGTYIAGDVIKLYKAIGSADQIIGARSLDHGNLPRLRYFIKRMAAIATGCIWRRSIPDLNSGLRLFTRQSFQVWSHLIPDGFSCSTTATLSALQANQMVLFAPIEYFPRAPESKSKFRTLTDSALLCRQVIYIYFQKLS